MKIAGLTFGGLLAGVLIGGCCYFICTLAHINLIWAYLLAAVLDVTGFIWLYKRYEQDSGTPDSLLQDKIKAQESAPEIILQKEPQPSETPEEVLI